MSAKNHVTACQTSCLMTKCVIKRLIQNQGIFFPNTENIQMAKVKVTTSFNDSEEECVQNLEVFILVSKHLGFVEIIRHP